MAKTVGLSEAQGEVPSQKLLPGKKGTLHLKKEKKCPKRLTCRHCSLSFLAAKTWASYHLRGDPRRLPGPRQNQSHQQVFSWKTGQPSLHMHKHTHTYRYYIENFTRPLGQKEVSLILCTVGSLCSEARSANPWRIHCIRLKYT